MAQTLDQKRAALAWVYAKEGMTEAVDDYRSLAKGASALIMNSGLMPTLAFYASKSKSNKGAAVLLGHLIRGFLVRLDDQKDLKLQDTQVQQCFSLLMSQLQKGSPEDYLRYTNEALELLKWIRQFVDAVPEMGKEA